MKKFRYYLLCFLITAGTLVISGCAATTSTTRYNTPKEKTDEDNSTIRFSSEKDKQKNNFADNVQKSDTTLNSDESVESDTDDTPANEKSIDISTLMKKLQSKDEKLTAGQSTLREKMLMEIIKYLDTPYKYGGNTSNGIDCSAFTQTVYSKTFSITLLRSAHEQFTEGDPVDDVDDLKFGDLVFFNTRRGVKPGHVGIYIGDHLFAHASSRNGVIVSSIDDAYYEKRFMGGRRIEKLFGSNDVTGSN
ncbi:MAG: C40 family peptidase [Ignavibacteriaceae bacterium]